MEELQFTGLVSEDSDDDTLQGDDENDNKEEYNDSSSILDSEKSRESGDGLKMYLQENG